MVLIAQPGASSWAFGALVVASVLAGVGVGWIGISERFRQWWLAHVSKSYLLDFCQDRITTQNGSLITREHLEQIGNIESPRIAVSFERALDMLLHLRDLSGEDQMDAMEPITDQLQSLGAQIVETETRVAALRPARLTSQLRRLDRQIATSDDIDAVEEWMEQKQALRRQLIQGDEARQRLQTLSQRLHELAARLEELVRRHTQDESKANDGDHKIRLEHDLARIDLQKTPPVASGS